MRTGWIFRGGAEGKEDLPWHTSEAPRFGRLARLLGRESWGLFLWIVAFRGDKAAYLRHLGARVGQDCDLHPPVKNFGSEPWLVEIGNRVTVASGVLFFTHDGASRLFRDRLEGSSPWGNRFGTIRIFDNCFIGANAILLPGVQVGPESIVGAGSVVTRSVPPRTVAAGVPARQLCSLEACIERYRSRMIPVEARDRRELRRELTRTLWGEER